MASKGPTHLSGVAFMKISGRSAAYTREYMSGVLLSRLRSISLVL